MFKLHLESAEEPEIKLTTYVAIEKARKFLKSIYFCFIDYAKALECVDYNELWKIIKEIRILNHLAYLLRNLYAGQEATVRTVMELQASSKSGNEYVKGIYCHSAYLTYMQSTS